MKCFALLLVLFIYINSNAADSCTDACDLQYNTTSSVIWCGSDQRTHNTTLSAIQIRLTSGSSDCYSKCGIAVKHYGPCGCPNNCYSDVGLGRCDTTLPNYSCVCNSGWKGSDCSSISCPNNNCSNKGVCKKLDKDKGDDYCICDSGYTGYDCSTRIPDHFSEVPYGSLPYGEYSSPEPYYAGEPNGDFNPVFNLTRMAAIRINISDADFIYQIDPSNRREVKYVKGKMFFDNGIIQTYQSVKFRIKGFSSRMLAKKNWNIKFDQLWNGVMGFSLKCGPNDRIITFPMISEFYRAMKAKTYRVSFATLHLNGFFYGVYMMHERLDEQLMQARFGVVKHMYQVSGAYFGGFLGSTPTPYQNLSVNYFDGISIPMIEQQVGDGNWDDFVLLASVLNCTSQGIPYVQQYMDISAFQRVTSVDLFTDSIDSYYGTGNNWIINNIGDSYNPHWIQMPTDYDNAFQSPYKIIAGLFGMTEAQVEYLITSGVTSLGGIDLLMFTLHPDPYKVINRPGHPIANIIYQVDGAEAKFTDIMTDLIQRVVFQHPGRVQARRKAFYEMTRNMVYRDKMYVFPGLFLEDVQSYEYAYNVLTPMWMNQRFSYLANMFITKGHGSCDALANCTCNADYYGPTCQTYIPPPTPSAIPTPVPTSTPPCAASATLTKLGDSWIENNVKHTQYDVSITNVGTRSISNIVLSISGAQIGSYWNFESVNDNYKLTLWNAIAPNGATPLSSYGFIARGDSKITLAVATLTCA